MKRIESFLLEHENLNKPYVVYRGNQFSYIEANRILRKVADSLTKLNIKGENVGVFASNSIEYIFAYFANIFSCSTNIPINVKLTDPEIVAELKYCDCNWIFVQSQYVDRLLKIPELFNLGIVEINEFGGMKLVRQAGNCVDRENSMDVAVMLHTSGTTGNPKKVMLSHRNLFANTQSNIESLKLTSDDIVLIALPLFFGYCHTAQFLTHTRLGSTIIIYDEPIFSAKHFCELVQRYRVSCFTAVPTMLTMIDSYPYIDKYDLSSLRYICFGGGSVSLEMLRRLMKKIPNAGMVQTYGQTECSPRVTALLPEDSLTKIGSVGKAIPGVTVEIVDKEDCVVGPEQVGEIRVSGENTTPGYYKNHEESSRILKKGWLYTGDFAKYDDHGYIYLVGRKKNMIISGGVNIYPEDIENIIKCHLAVEDVLVKAKEHDILGEVPVAYVMLKQEFSLTIEELHRFLEKKIAQFKWPKELVIVDSFEKTFTGKTKRNCSDSRIIKHKTLLAGNYSNSSFFHKISHDNEYDLIVSLGTTCQTAYQLKRMYLRKYSGPLDWFITPFNSMLKLLENNFECFMEMGNLEVTGEYQNENMIVEDTRYCVKSYHEFPLGTSGLSMHDLYPSFKEKIDRRIRRFLQQLNELDNILFVVNAANVSRDDYLKLIDVMKSLRSGRSFHILANGYSVPKQNYMGMEKVSFVRFSKLVMPKQNIRWRLGSNNEWDSCFDGIKLKENSSID